MFLFSRKCHYKVSFSALSAFWWVIKIDSSVFCMFSVWSCHELKAGFHPRLFCLCLNANVSFHFRSYHFFWSRVFFVTLSFKRAGLAYAWTWVILYLTETIWYRGRLILRFGTCLEKTLQDMAASYVPYSPDCSFSFTFEMPIIWSMCVDYVLWIKWIGKLSCLAMEFSFLKCSTESFVPVQKGEIYSRRQ